MTGWPIVLALSALAAIVVLTIVSVPHDRTPTYTDPDPDRKDTPWIVAGVIAFVIAMLAASGYWIWRIA